MVLIDLLCSPPTECIYSSIYDMQLVLTIVDNFTALEFRFNQITTESFFFANLDKRQAFGIKVKDIISLYTNHS